MNINSKTQEPTYRKIINSFAKDGNLLMGLVKLPYFVSNTLDFILASAVINILTLALPLTLMQAYDRIIPYQSLSTLFWLVFGCLSALILETMLRIARSYIMCWVGARYEHLVGLGAIEKLLTARLEDFEASELGTHLDRINSISILRGFYSGQVFQVLLDIPFAVLFLVTIWYIGQSLLFVPVVVIVLFLVLVFFFKRRFENSRTQQTTVNDRIFSFIIELFGGIHSVKSLTMEEQMLRRYERLQASRADSNMEVTFWSMLPSNMGNFFSQVTMFGIIGFGASSVIEGNLTLGSLTACTLLGSRALSPIQNLAGFWLRFSDAEIAKKRLMELAQLQPESDVDQLPFPSDIDGYIELKDVNFQYRKDTELLIQNLSFKFDAGEMIGFKGNNPQRTTAIFYLIMGKLQPLQGEIYIDEYAIQQWDCTNLNGRIEYIPHTGDLFKGTILDNISLFNPQKRLIAQDTAALLGLDQMVSQLPKGYETLVGGQLTGTLPTVLIQHISIARALTVRPRILLIDRTFSAMDEESEDMLLSILQNLKGKCTIILVSNKTSILNACDTVYEVTKTSLVPLENI
jgi:ATP-binding cassette, subfamily C, bacterial LapB